MASLHTPRRCLLLSSSTPARAFLQVASKRTLHTQPFLDFLHPTPVVHPTARRRQILHLKPSRRHFSDTPARKATAVIHNPKKDEDGAEMSVEITARASKRLKEIMLKDQNPNLALRITVESGGCHGFQYLMSLTTLPPLTTSDSAVQKSNDSALQDLNTTPKEAVLDGDDTVFAADDGTEAKVVMDGPSLELLKGSKVDYTMELIGSQFKIVDNPLASSSCGCGTSFDIKI